MNFILGVILTAFATFGAVIGKCGSPNLPFGAIEPLKEIFEENETFEIKCFGGRTVPTTNETVTIECRNNTWRGESVRCTQVLQFNNVSIDVINENTIAPMTINLQSAMVKELTDKDPQTCVALDDEQFWTINFEKPKTVVSVVLMVTNNEDELLAHNHSFVHLSLYSGNASCTIREHTHGEDIPMIFIIYECFPLNYANNLTLHLKGNGTLLNICDIEVFTINDDDCGKHELPIYSLVNVFKIQNQSRIAEYTCPKGYLLHGSKVKICGKDGVWYPNIINTCEPKIKCDLLPENETTNGMVRLHYVQLDLYGNAIPDESSIEYECSNASLAFPQPVIRYCTITGDWSPIEFNLTCYLKEDIEMMSPEMIGTNGYFILGLCVVVFVCCGVMLLIVLHSKRIVKKLQYKWKETVYKQPRKVNPTIETD